MQTVRTQYLPDLPWINGNGPWVAWTEKSPAKVGVGKTEEEAIENMKDMENDVEVP